MTDIGTEDERFAAFLRSAVRQLDVPETPRDAMWTAIAARRQHRAPVQVADWSTFVAPPVTRGEVAAADTVHVVGQTTNDRGMSVVRGDGASARPTVVRRSIPVRWAMPIAAAILALGIGIGNTAHFTRQPAAKAPANLASANPAAPAMLPMQMMTEAHFKKVYAGLAKFASSTQGNASRAQIDATNKQMAEWAGQMMTVTQTFLDSHAPMDARQRELLKDLENVLLQMSQLSNDMPDDNEFVRQTMAHEQLLQRLQSAAPVSQRAL